MKRQGVPIFYIADAIYFIKIMNSIWLNNISNYKSTSQAIYSAQRIIEMKVKRRNFLLKKYGIIVLDNQSGNQDSFQRILLYEAREAKYFWKNFSILLPLWCNFQGRKATSSDIANRLLDIGYHHITNVVITIINKYDVSSTLGILHSAHSSKSAPLAYDLVEMFRADIVEAEALRFLRSKKKSISTLKQKDIGIFLSQVNKRLNKKYFLRDFQQCHQYKYYMELQILKFIKAVNHKEIFSPLYLPVRHESRCRP